jgi:2-methylisocitrate lyase-like PEP mutase family enzyme
MTFLREIIAKDNTITVIPGVYDAFTALLAEEAGFPAVYLSGGSLAYTKLGRPDIGLVSMSEVADSIRYIRDRIELPIVVDADTGYGNALNVQRTIRVFERAGASAIQLEDQSLPKRCGHLAGKSLISAGEMEGKIKAAVDSRHTEETLIVARTDAIAVESFDAALDRAERYVAAGADILFVESPRTHEELAAIGERFGARVPVLANMVEGGNTPITNPEDLAKLGYRIAIFPGGLARAMLRQARAYFASLKQHGTNKPFTERMADFNELNAAIGLKQILAESQKYKDTGLTR